MRIIDTSSDFQSVYDDGKFNLDAWEIYIDRWIPNAKELCLRDMKDCINAGCSWDKDYVPVLNAVHTNHEKREETIRAFYEISEHLEEKLTKVFGKSVDADIVLYIGLCNGAGWVTKIQERTIVLLGIEKIIELDWCRKDDMVGLMIHELGHVYQSQYGSLSYQENSMAEKFLWQLFTEGVAMVFEQEIVGDAEYYHQNKNGWKEWCDQNYELLKSSFCHDMTVMTQENQRYFGDWVRFEGHSDVGYYLGARFVRHLLKNDCFENIINYTFERVQKEFARFMDSN